MVEKKTEERIEKKVLWVYNKYGVVSDTIKVLERSNKNGGNKYGNT